VKNVYLLDLYDALVWYVRAAKRAAKGRGIQLLIRVLREFNASSEILRQVSLQKVQTNYFIYSSASDRFS